MDQADGRSPSAQWLRGAGAALIAAAALICYLPSLRGDFILDDDILLTDSKLVKAPNGVYRFWFSTEPIDYWPLTNTSLWLEWRLWGANATGYRVTNLLLHIASALLLWRILDRLAIPGAWLAALLFAVHPVNVQSVAWIAQRKNTLSMLFFLLSILWYLKSEGSRSEPSGPGAPGARLAGRTRWYWLSLLAFILAMLSKGSVAILPAVLLGITWWQRGRLTKRDLARSLPFFAIAGVLTLVNIWFQAHGGGHWVRDAGFVERLLGAGAVVWFYLYKAIAPLNLVFVYPQWNIQISDPRWWLPLLATIAVTALLLWQRNTRQGRPLLFAWLFFCVALLPVMGFTNIGFMAYSLVSDHYQHIAIIGVAALVGAGLAVWHQRARGTARRVSLITAGLIVVLLAARTFRQNQLYADSITLYESTLEQNPDSWQIHNNLASDLHKAGDQQAAIEHAQRTLELKSDSHQAHLNLANALVQLGRIDEAIAHYEEALRLEPNYPQAHNNLGDVLLGRGLVGEALAHFQQAARLRPDNATTQNHLGNAFVRIGRTSEAVAYYQRALVLNPDFAEAHNNLGGALGDVGRLPEAIVHCQRALQLRPDFAEAHNTLAIALFQSGRQGEAVDHYEQALKLKPDYAEAHNNLGQALAVSGKLDQAMQHYRQALQLNPNYAQAHKNMANALLQSGRLSEAIASFEQSLKLDPASAVAHHNLARALAQSGQLPAAITHFEQAVQLKPDYLLAHFNLAAAYSSASREADAVRAARRALELARATGQTDLAAQIEQRLKAYQAKQSGAPAQSQPAAPP